ncbi:PSD1 and planctomycete cytochrome C domain-containing protein [Singulisphaera rosea]
MRSPNRRTFFRAFRYLSVLTAVLAVSVPLAVAGEEIQYNRDVRPILSETCFRCHGPGDRKAGLRLDLREEAIKPAESGAVPIVPGHLEESELIRRILTEDETEVMPPPKAHKTLSTTQKDLLKRWVQSGATYQKHWSFEPPLKEPAPKVNGSGVVVRNSIDAFIAERARSKGLTPSPEADKETLIRRVAFTLTGLPPTPAEVELYLGDSSSRSYENMVERYLFSPRYGEEMARHWLDVARYADTHGLHLDNERAMWPYRDWVVRAFNDNVPFDRFTVEQLAGDLLEKPTRDQLIATGFNRCNVTTSEGGSIEAEWYFRNAVDRSSTMAETWMGLTAGCAVCHDHKYDPISAKEFYSLYAFFYSAAGPAMDGNALLHEPTLKLPTPDQESKLAELTKAVADAKQAVEAASKFPTYIDPADSAVAKVEGSAPEEHGKLERAKDPQYSFRAWVEQGGGAASKDLTGDIKEWLGKQKAGTLAEGDAKKLREHYLKNVCESTKGTFAALAQEAARREKERASLDGAIPVTYIFRDMETPRQAFVMLRGQYDKTGEKVEPSTPKVLPELRTATPGARPNRLDLARWLVSQDHPLTARVAVNRFWQQFFGTGLVKTSFDFGTQGESPTHPELLDWLAVTFREGNWDVRDLVRLMLHSATFRQSTRVTAEMLQIDPDNRYYARGPRFRLDAEQVRDNALYVGGLLDTRMGGKGVKPYQPSNIWEPVAFTGSNTREYHQDSGQALYRRSLYTFLKRTAPPPFMANFDAPNRESFCTRRERSNTPLQALQLMNDVQHFESARGLAERILREGGTTPEARINYGFRVVLSRRPDAEELAVLREQCRAHLERFRTDKDAAKAVTHFGESQPTPGLPEEELAAYTLLANTLLNLDETVTRN